MCKIHGQDEVSVLNHVLCSVVNMLHCFHVIVLNIDCNYKKSQFIKNVPT